MNACLYFTTDGDTEALYEGAYLMATGAGLGRGLESPYGKYFLLKKKPITSKMLRSKRVQFR